MKTKKILVGIVVLIIIVIAGAISFAVFSNYQKNLKSNYFASYDFESLKNNFNKEIKKDTLDKEITKVVDGKTVKTKITEDDLNSYSKVIYQNSELNVLSSYYNSQNQEFDLKVELSKIESLNPSVDISSIDKDLTSKLSELSEGELYDFIQGYFFLKQMKEITEQDIEIYHGTKPMEEVINKFKELKYPSFLEDYHALRLIDLENRKAFYKAIEDHDPSKKFPPDKYGAASQEELAHFRKTVELLTDFPKFPSFEYDLEKKFEEQKRTDILNKYKEIGQIINNLIDKK